MERGHEYEMETNKHRLVYCFVNTWCSLYQWFKKPSTDVFNKRYQTMPESSLQAPSRYTISLLGLPA